MVLSRSSLCTRSLTIFLNCCTSDVSGKSCPSKRTKMGDRRSTTQEFILPLGGLKPMDALMPFSRGLCRSFTRKSTSTSVSSTVMVRPQRRRKAATISDSAGTSTSKGTKLWPSAIATAMCSHLLFQPLGIIMSRRCCRKRCRK